MTFKPGILPTKQQKGCQDACKSPSPDITRMWLYINVTYILDTLGVNTCVELGVIPVLMSKRIISKPTPQYSQDIRDHSILLAQSPTPNNNKKMDIFSCITSIRNTNQPTKLQPQPSTPPPHNPHRNILGIPQLRFSATAFSRQGHL